MCVFNGQVAVSHAETVRDMAKVAIGQ